MQNPPIDADPVKVENAVASRLLPACLAFFMSCLVAAVVTAVNTGVGGGYTVRWLSAWALAAPVAILAAYLVRPIAWRLALILARLARAVSNRR